MFRKLALIAALLILPARTTYALQADELLSLVAMPLAVASVSELTGVPADALANIVQLLNDGAVPPAEVIEVVRYVPVALVETDPNRNFVQYVTLQRQQGLAGTPLVTSIERELRTYGMPGIDLQVTAPRLVLNRDTDLVPPLVRTRVAERSTHPHGGPPGQLKKALGVQTGAEVVHGSRPGHEKGNVKEKETKFEEKTNGLPPPKMTGPPPKQREMEDHGKGHGDKDKKHGKGNKGKGKG
jgi:hypothetical protein